jgi:hypothetical protein
MKKLLVAIAAAGLFASGGTTAHAALGVDFDKPTLDYLQQSDPLLGSVAGWSFTANRDLFVRALGIYDHDPDLFLHSETHSVGLWKADGTLLKSVSIYEPQYPHQQELVNGKYHFADAGNVMLKAGQSYIVAAVMNPDTFTVFFNQAQAAAHNLVFDANITYGEGRYASSLSLVAPEITAGGIGYFGANIDVVPTPVPAAAWLLGSGLLGLVGLKRRNKQ